MFRLFSILDDALDSIAWMIVFNFASNGYSRRGTDEHSVSGNESGPRVGQISGNGLSSIPENQRVYGVDPHRIHDWHLILYVTGLVTFYLASARLAVLPQGGDGDPARRRQRPDVWDFGLNIRVKDPG